MADQFNFGDNSTFNGNQFGGNGNLQTNYFNNYSNNSDVKKVQDLIEEFNQLQIANEEWKNIFMEGMKDLMELKDADNIEKEEKPKKGLNKFYNNLKELVSIKNILSLPVDIQEKEEKLIEMSKHIVHHLEQVPNLIHNLPNL